MFIYELSSWLRVLSLIFVKKRLVSRKKETIYKSEMSLPSVDPSVTWYNTILLILFIVSKSTNHVTSDEAKDTAHWFPIADRLVYSPSTALSDEYLSSVCQVGFLYARLSLGSKVKKISLTIFI